MKVLIGCECSGTVRDAFLRAGHDAWSCDLEPSRTPGPHIQADVLQVMCNGTWDMMIVHPPCTFLCSSGLHWNRRGRGHEGTEKALEFVRALMAAPIQRIALGNPVGRIGTAIRPADQFIQPYQFGEDASKDTGLWLKNLPILKPTRFVYPRIVWINGKPAMRWGNQTDSGQNKLGPSDTRSEERSVTYWGIAKAMADQWGATA
jgi:hypothetical protein